MKPAKPAIDIGLVVADLPAMRAFYEGILGLEVVAERSISWGEMVELAFGESHLRLVGPPEPPAPAPTGLQAALGLRFITFEIADFDATVEALRAAGAPVEMEVTPIRDLRIAMFRDPEGNLVEFLER